jgi:uncharacterized protein (DUF1800 family)
MSSIQKIKHLSWRAGFGLSPSQWAKTVSNPSLPSFQQSLFQPSKELDTLSNELDYYSSSDMSMMSNQEKNQMNRQNSLKLTGAWIEDMAHHPTNSLHEKMTLFWHGHFACRILIPNVLVNHLQTIRKNALGNFRDLVLGIAKDPGMIRYLNNQQNRKRSPNENFARELMELFTIGRGNYTEMDIKEAARSFTGWSSNREGRYIFRPFIHDNDIKEFMGKKGNFNGDDIVDILLEKKETAQFICTKIYKYFVNQIVDLEIIEQLTDRFYASDYDIQDLMQSIFTSEWFFAEKNVGTKIKSPIELLVGMSRSLGIKLENKLSWTFFQRALGQQLFIPPNVAGWPGGKAWIDNSTLMTRLSLINVFMDGVKNARFKFAPAINISELENSVMGYNTKDKVSYLKTYFFNHENAVNEETTHRILRASTDELSRMVRILLSVPEYQMC